MNNAAKKHMADFDQIISLMEKYNIPYDLENHTIVIPIDDKSDDKGSHDNQIQPMEETQPLKEPSTSTPDSSTSSIPSVPSIIMSNPGTNISDIDTETTNLDILTMDDLETLESEIQNQNQSQTVINEDETDLMLSDSEDNETPLSDEELSDNRETREEFENPSDSDDDIDMNYVPQYTAQIGIYPGHVATSTHDIPPVRFCQSGLSDFVYNLLSETPETVSSKTFLEPTIKSPANLKANSKANPKTNLKTNSNPKSDIKTNISSVSPSKDKIILNVGGKRFNIRIELLEKLGINYTRLPKIVNKLEARRVVYFLDRDYYYFAKIIKIIKEYGFDDAAILNDTDRISDQLMSELCLYGIISKEHKPTPCIKLGKKVGFINRHSEIAKIIVDKQVFSVSTDILSRSDYFNSKIKMSRSNVFSVDDIGPKIFRCVLNLLRHGELFVYDDDIIKALDKYGIVYEIMPLTNHTSVTNSVPHSTTIAHQKNNYLNTPVARCYTGHPVESLTPQQYKVLDFFDPKNFPKNEQSNYEFHDNKYYHPSSLTVSYTTENMNVVMTQNQLKFGTKLIFNLNDISGQPFDVSVGKDCIEDILLCIDIPVLADSDEITYVDFVEYILVESIQIIVTELGDQNPSHPTPPNRQMLFQKTGHEIYMHPLIYSSNSKEYHQLSSISVNKTNTKLLYNNQLIDVHRIILPCYFFRDKRNHLPIKKMASRGKLVQLLLDIAPVNKIINNSSRQFRQPTKEIPLLNVCLINNYVAFPKVPSNQVLPPTSILSKLHKDNKEVLSDPAVYLYELSHCRILLVGDNCESNLFNIARIPLDPYGLIKDFYFGIMRKSDFDNNQMDKFIDGLIDLDICETTIPPQYLVHTQLDGSLMNQYIPLRKLGHRLPMGLYYYSFSADPTQSMILGEFIGTNSFLQMKLKKSPEPFVIKLVINQHHLHLI